MKTYSEQELQQKFVEIETKMNVNRFEVMKSEKFFKACKQLAVKNGGHKDVDYIGYFYADYIDIYKENKMFIDDVCEFL